MTTNDFQKSPKPNIASWGIFKKIYLYGIIATALILLVLALVLI